jgi:hypothetical protein
MAIDWDSVRAMALDCLNSALDLQRWAERSQQKDYDVDSATQHLAAIFKARDTFDSSLAILPSGYVAQASEPPRQLPIFDELAKASAHENDRPDFMFASTAHEAVFRLLGMAILHIENNLNNGLAIKDLERFPPKKLRETFYQLERKDPLKNVLGSYARLQNLQAWIHRERAAVSRSKQRVNIKKAGRPKGTSLSKDEKDCLRNYEDGKKPGDIDAMMLKKSGAKRKNGDSWEWGTASKVIEAAKTRGEIPRKLRRGIS